MHGLLTREGLLRCKRRCVDTLRTGRQLPHALADPRQSLALHRAKGRRNCSWNKVQRSDIEFVRFRQRSRCHIDPGSARSLTSCVYNAIKERSMVTFRMAGCVADVDIKEEPGEDLTAEWETCQDLLVVFPTNVWVLG